MKKDYLIKELIGSSTMDISSVCKESKFAPLNVNFLTIKIIFQLSSEWYVEIINESTDTRLIQNLEEQVFTLEKKD